MRIRTEKLPPHCTARAMLSNVSTAAALFRELNANYLCASPNNFTDSRLLRALSERKFKATRHLRRHRRYNLCPVLRNVHHLTFLVCAPRLDDPSRQIAGAPNFALKMLGERSHQTTYAGTSSKYPVPSLSSHQRFMALRCFRRASSRIPSLKRAAQPPLRPAGVFFGGASLSSN